MHTGKGQVLELLLEDGRRYIRVACAPNLIPAPGQYVLASDSPDAPLPLPLFYTDSAPNGFIALTPPSAAWEPGQELHLLGPLGRGFAMPLAARRIGMVAFDDSPARFRGLIRVALRQDAAIVLVSSLAPEYIPDEVEVQPLSTLSEILEWANYLAFDVGRENLPQLREQLGMRIQQTQRRDAQVLVRTPIPCGGIAECGVCAVAFSADWKLACKDGPVFDWDELP